VFRLFLCFFYGLVLSFVSFRVLPISFSLIGVYLSTFFILLSITLLGLYESKLRSINAYNAVIMLPFLIISIDFFVNIHGIIISLCGGILLYASSASITENRDRRFFMHISSTLGVLVGILIGF